MKETKNEIQSLIKEEFGEGLSAAIAREMSDKVNGEALAALCTEENIENFAARLFAFADKDGNKELSFEEFSQFIEHHASLQPHDRIGLDVVTGDSLIDAVDCRDTTESECQ